MLSPKYFCIVKNINVCVPHHTFFKEIRKCLGKHYFHILPEQPEQLYSTTNAVS